MGLERGVLRTLGPMVRVGVGRGEMCPCTDYGCDRVRSCAEGGRMQEGVGGGDEAEREGRKRQATRMARPSLLKGSPRGVLLSVNTTSRVPTAGDETDFWQ